MMARALTLLGAFAILTATSLAAKPADELTEFKSGDAVEVRADRAYLLFRVTQQKGVRPMEPLLMRVPTDEEIARYDAAKAKAFADDLPKLTRQYERDLENFRQDGDASARMPVPPALETYNFVWDEVANLQDVDYGNQLTKSSAEETFLVEAVPGDYVLYGFTPSTGLPRLMVCMCLGTVGFSARAGEVTDLGYIISDFTFGRSQAPELAGTAGYAGTVRHARSDSSIPQVLADKPITPAQYRAVGRFFTPNAVNIERLVPVPGVLDYDRGKVIDAVTGQVVPDNL